MSSGLEILRGGVVLRTTTRRDVGDLEALTPFVTPARSFPLRKETIGSRPWRARIKSPSMRTQSQLGKRAPGTNAPPAGVEPATWWVEATRSVQLSYGGGHGVGTSGRPPGP